MDGHDQSAKFVLGRGVVAVVALGDYSKVADTNKLPASNIPEFYNNFVIENWNIYGKSGVE